MHCSVRRCNFGRKYSIVHCFAYIEEEKTPLAIKAIQHVVDTTNTNACKMTTIRQGRRDGDDSMFLEFVVDVNFLSSKIVNVTIFRCW